MNFKMAVHEMTKDVYKIAGVQMDVQLGDVSLNLQNMVQALRHSDAATADLVVFPECALTGYCFESREEALPYAQTNQGPAVTEIQKICHEQDQFVAFGFLERADDKLYNSCALVGPQGLVGVYRKVHLPYLGIDRFVDPGTEGWGVYEINGLRVGMHICYDGSFPEAARVMALAGADLVLLPTNWPPGADTFAKYLPNARALENSIYFFCVDRIGQERGFRFIGYSRLCDTNGNPLADAPHANPEVLVGDIDVRKARAKRIVRVPGKHVIDRFADRRPEYYGPVCQPHGLSRDVSE
jgi:5-aminopentanamidase